MVAHGSITAKIVPGPALYSPESKRVKFSDCGIHLESHKTVEPIINQGWTKDLSTIVVELKEPEPCQAF